MLGRCTITLRPLRHRRKETGLENQLEFGLSSAETPLPAPPKAARLGCGVLPPAASFPPSGTSLRSRGAGRCLRGALREGKAQWFKGRSAAAPGRDFSPGCSSSLPSPAAVRGWGGFPSPGVWRGFPSPGVRGWLERAKLRAAGCARTRWHGMALGSRWHRGLGTAPGAGRLQGAHGEMLGTGRVWGMLCSPALAEKMTAGAIGAVVFLFFISPPSLPPCSSLCASRLAASAPLGQRRQRWARISPLCLQNPPRSFLPRGC